LLKKRSYDGKEPPRAEVHESDSWKPIGEL
jgi:hypothetical protein